MFPMKVRCATPIPEPSRSIPTAPPDGLHLLDLAYGGLAGEWPRRDRSAVRLQVDYLTEWAPAAVTPQQPKRPITEGAGATPPAGIATAKNAKQWRWLS
jgi:hypothetical protein